MFNLTKPFAGSLEEVVVTDPWGHGVEFIVRPVGPKFRERVAGERGDGTGEVTRRALGAAGREMALAQVRGEQIDKEEFAGRLMKRMEEEIESLPSEVFQALASRQVASAELVVDELLVGWSGLIDEDTNEAVPFSKEAAMDLLTAEEMVPAGMPYGGMTVGEALRVFLVVSASGSMKAIEEAAEVVEKNSESSSAGAA